jgi:hypothetical protein
MPGFYPGWFYVTFLFIYQLLIFLYRDWEGVGPALEGCLEMCAKRQNGTASKVQRRGTQVDG